VDNTLIIDEIDLDIARDVCNDIKDLAIRNKAMANVFAAKFAKKYFSDIDIDVNSGLHNIPKLIEKYDFADIYLRNSRIEVRLYLDGELLTVPNSHYKVGILPFAYMFIKIDSSLTNADLTGFVLADRIGSLDTGSEFYKINNDEILDFESFVLYLNQNDSNIIDEYDETLISQLYDFTDNKLTESEIDELIKKVITSRNARLKLIDIARTQIIFNYISTDPKEHLLTENTITNIEEDRNEELSVTIEDLLVSDEIENTISTNNNPRNFTEEILESEEQGNREIQELFEAENEDDNSVENFINTNKNKKVSYLIPLFLLLILGSASYFAYTKFVAEEPVLTEQKLVSKDIKQEPKSTSLEKTKPIDMPLETVENIKAVALEEEVTSATIPLIEQNLGASIAISNLNINWDVPVGYTTNTTAQRYLIKIGKIIQLNLKAELLLLNKSPISNKISLELEFNKDTNKFKVNNIISSSGEKAIDNLVVNTVNNVLLMEQKMNMKVFENLVGNPVLIIRL